MNGIISPFITLFQHSVRRVAAHLNLFQHDEKMLSWHGEKKIAVTVCKQPAENTTLRLRDYSCESNRPMKMKRKSGNFRNRIVCVCVTEFHNFPCSTWTKWCPTFETLVGNLQYRLLAKPRLIIACSKFGKPYSWEL